VASTGATVPAKPSQPDSVFPTDVDSLSNLPVFTDELTKRLLGLSDTAPSLKVVGRETEGYTDGVVSVYEELRCGRCSKRVVTC
jgi:hypothetical protein